ncbi:MAG TPA: HAD family phosphatase [Sphingomicrobium sp.]|nr:HAD family phosphatase [Sphingomicrobium sp.]
MARPKAIIFDFDGVLLESEHEGNRELARLLTELGHPHSLEDALEHYTGFSGKDFIAAVESRIGRELPAEFHERLREMSVRALRDGIVAVAGAVEFVRSLPPGMPKAVASSSSTRWVLGHLEHIGLAGAFGTHVYSGKEHVERGKPEPDLYLHAADQLGVPIGGCVIVEDSRVGATGALASGARVIGLAAGSHCLSGHDAMLRSLGVDEIAFSFDDLRAFLA